MRRNELGRWALVAVVAALAVGVWRAGAQNTAPASRPATVAMVDLEQVINKLDELKARDAELKAFVTERQQVVTDIQKKLDQERTTLQILPKNSPEAKAAVEKALRFQMSAEFETKLGSELIDQMEGELQAALFEKVVSAVERLAKQRGYDIVLSNDGNLNVQRGQKMQVSRQIAGRRILYANPTYDISAEVLQMMNNEWRALGGAATGGGR